MDLVAAEETTGTSKDDEFSAFRLPFKVATFPDIGQRAYINEHGNAEWLFARAHDQCQITTEPGRLLRLNKEHIAKQLEELQVPVEQFHYRGQGQPGGEDPQAQWKDHTFESRAFLVVLLWLIKNRTLKAVSKMSSLKLALGLVAKAFEVSGAQKPFMMMLTKPDGVLVSCEMKFSMQGLCQMWGGFLQHCPGAVALWKKLGSRCWLNRCISSSMDNATIQDIFFFLTYLYCHPKLKQLSQNLRLCVAKTCLPDLLCKLGLWLDELATQQSNLALQMLPQLKSKAGFARKVADPVNKVLLLFKLRKEKQHRQRIARTHDELGGGTNRMMVFESYLDCLLHLKALEATFENINQVSIAWDPSTYGGKDMFMGIVYSPAINKAAYLMTQQMSQTMISELDLSLLGLGKGRKLTRLESYKEMKGLSASLRSLGLSLESFSVPEDLLCRPLQKHEFRLAGVNGRFYIKDEKSQQIRPEVPDHISLGDLPCLVSISDQGPNVMAATNFLMYGPSRLLFFSVYDVFHRAWNDLKSALRGCSCGAWRTVLELTLVANLAYGPFGSGTWHFKKLSKLDHFLTTENVTSDCWSKFQHLICRERRISEPTSMDDSQALFDSLRNMDSFLTKGPLVKLMRWFSFFESMAFLDGELMATKMVLESSMGHVEDGSDQEVEELPKDAKTHQQELAALKKRKGSWVLAPQLITSKSLAVKDCIMAVGKASWKLFAARAREITSPEHVLEFNIAASRSNFWMNELVEIAQESLFGDNLHLQPLFRGHDQVVEWHVSLFSKLLEQRAMSLSATHQMPPSLYCHVLSPSLDIARAAHDLAMKHWKILLEVEGAELEGVNVKPLKVMHWRLNPLIRCLFMAYEEDEAKHMFFSGTSSSRKLQRVLSKHIGDSRVVENIHQHGRDLFRSSKANTISNIAIMSNALRSGVLEGRKVPMVSAEKVDKAVGTQWNQKWKGSVASSLKSKGAKVTPEMQSLMVGQSKKKGHSWPSPSPGAIFNSVAATQWLFHFWRNPDYQHTNVNESWLSVLAQPGSVLAQMSTGMLIWAMASAEFGFLGMDMKVEVVEGERWFLCQPQRASIKWHRIHRLDDWVSVKAEPGLVHGHKGPVGWKSCGTPIHLAHAACVAGLFLTHMQMCDLIKHLGGTLPKGTLSKKVVHTHLISMVVPEDEKEKAMQYVGDIGGGPDDGFDTDFSEVVSELGQDDANIQDLKDLKAKKKNRKLKKLLATHGKDEPVQGKPKAKAKAKGKAKGKPKAKAKEKQSLGRSLLKRASLLHAKGQPDAMDVAMESAPPEVAGAAAPASSSSVAPSPAPALLPDAAPSEAEGVLPSEALPPVAPADAASEADTGPKAPPRERAERRRSPEEIMKLLEPPGCRMGISFQDHRFTSSWKKDHKELGGVWGQKSFSRTFVSSRSWKEALSEVHMHNWKKWDLLKEEYPLGSGQAEQTPGHIPEELQDQLKPTIDGLGEVVRYT